MPKSQKISLSPSLCHLEVMKGIRPSHAFAGGDVVAWKRKLRSKLKALVGVMKNSHAPLHVRSLWTREHKLGSIEKIVFQSEPGADVPAYVCLPKKRSGRIPFFVCVQGHSTGMHNSIAVAPGKEHKAIAVEGDRDFGLQCMRHGLGALCIEQRSFGERAERDQKAVSGRMCLEAAMHALILGRTLIGERVFDVDRGLDYLATREDVDMRRIGLMGNSGGGTITMFASALLSRIAFAMPSCYICTFYDSLQTLYHCECNYVPGLYPVADMADIMGLFAPKPLVVVAGRKDPIFPIEATRKAFTNIRRIYRAAGAADRCRLVEGAGGHRFYAKEAWPVMLELMSSA